MTPYTPKTLQVQRDAITQFFTATKSGNAQWWTDEVSAAVVADLAHAEACLAERDAEIERLKAQVQRLQDHITDDEELSSNDLPDHSWS